jgi:hypothetical protein
MVTAVIGWNIPASCLSGSTCDYFGSQIQAGLGAGQTFTCTGTSNCSCTQGLLTNIADSGSYGSAGSNLVLTSTVSGTTSTGGYCVQGSTLHLVTVDATMSTGPGGGPAINQDVVAQKQ